MEQRTIHVVVSAEPESSFGSHERTRFIAAFISREMADGYVSDLGIGPRTRNGLGRLEVFSCPIHEAVPVPAFVFRAELNGEGEVVIIERTYLPTPEPGVGSEGSDGYGQSVQEAIAEAQAIRVRYLSEVSAKGPSR